jgi:hypothetical protein
VLERQTDTESQALRPVQLVHMQPSQRLLQMLGRLRIPSRRPTYWSTVVEILECPS